MKTMTLFMCVCNPLVAVAILVVSQGTASSPPTSKQNNLSVPCPSSYERPKLVKDAIAQNRPLHYFGLGSNMLRTKLENRGLNNTKIDILTMEAAVVPGHRLAFNMRGFPPIEPGMGSLEPIDAASRPLLAYERNECHGALVKLSPENYEKVMRSEGVGGAGGARPSAEQGYEEVVVDAHPYGRGKPVKAVALRARPHVRLSFDPRPSPRYMRLLREGARELGLTPSYQAFLARLPVQRLAAWQRQQAIYNILFTLTVSYALKWRGLSRLQSRLLFLVYARPHAPRVIKVASDVITTAILLPGAIFGYLLYAIWKVTKTTPPQVMRMMEFLVEEESDSSSTTN